MGYECIVCYSIQSPWDGENDQRHGSAVRCHSMNRPWREAVVVLRYVSAHRDGPSRQRVQILPRFHPRRDLAIRSDQNRLMKHLSSRVNIDGSVKSVTPS